MAEEDLQELTPEDADALGLQPLSDDDAGAMGYERLPEPESYRDGNLRPLSEDEISERGLIPLSPESAREQGLEPLTQAESAPDSFWREARHSILPTLGSLPAMGAGAKAGAALGAAGGPVAWATVPAGAIAGGVAGALGGGYLISSIQEWALKKLGLSDTEQRAANEEENPYSSFAGQLAPAVLAFSPGKIGMSVANRLLGGGLQGGLEAGQEYAHKGSIDPYKVTAATAFGAVFAQPNRLGRRGMEMGERWVPGGPSTSPVPGRPDLEPRPGADVEKADAFDANVPLRPDTSTATEAPPPNDTLTSTGMPESVIGVRSAREYPKETAERPVVESQDPARPVSADVAVALRAEQGPRVGERGWLPEALGGEGNQNRPQQRGWLPDELTRPPERRSQDQPVPTERRAIPPAEVVMPSDRVRSRQQGEDFVPQGESQLDVPTPVTERPARPQQRIETGLAEASRTVALTRPKIIDTAIERAKASGHEQIAKALDAVDPREAMQVATKYLRALENQSGEIKNTGQAGKPAEYATARVPSKAARVEELNVTARSKADAARKGGAIRALRASFEKHVPTDDVVPSSKEQISAFKKRLSDAVQTATEGYGGKDPLSYRPREKPAEWLWLRAAKRIVDGKRTTPRQIAEFIALEKQLRSGRAEDVRNVRQERRIESDIQLTRRPSVEDAEAGRAREFPGEAVSPEDVQGVPERITGPEQLAERPPTYEVDLSTEAPREIDLSTATPEQIKTVEQQADAMLANETPADADAPVTKSWKDIQADEEAARAARTAQLKEMRAKAKGKPTAAETMSVFLGDESGAGVVPQWLQNMFTPRTQQAQQRVAATLLDQVKPAKTLKVWGSDMISRHSDPLFGGRANNPIRKWHEANEKAAVKARDLIEQDGQFVDRSVQMMDKYRGQQWDDFTRLVYDESYYKIYGDRPATRQDQGFRLTDWSRAHHHDLEQRWNALPDELKDLRQDWYDLAAKSQEKLTQGLGDNKLYKLMGLRDPALVKRIIDGNETPADTAAYGDDLIEAVRKHAKATMLDGPFVPMRRFGKWVVNAKYNVPTPSSFLRRVNDNTFEFDTRGDVTSYVQSLDLSPTVRSYFVDAQGNRTYTANGKEYRYHKDDPGVSQRWEVEVQDNHVEFTDTYRDAQTRRTDLQAGGGLRPDSFDIQPKRFRPGSDAVALAENLGMNTLRGNKHFQSLPDSTQQLVRNAMAEEYLMAMAATRGGSSRVHRSNVPGYDMDFVRSISQYVQESGHRRAQLEYRPMMDEALETAESMTSPGADPQFSAARRAVLNEVKSRDASMLNADYDMNATTTGRALHRLLALSQAARLMTPGYSIRNSTQPITIAAPVLTSHFGKAGADALWKVYGEIGSMKVIGTGLKETVRAARGDTTQAKLLDDVKQRLPDQFSKDAIEYFRQTGAIDGDAGFMVHKFAASRDGVRLDIGREQSRATDFAEAALTKADRAIEWIDEIGRQLPRAVETINRATVGLAAARMEFARNGGNKDAAMQFGKDVIDQTQFRYSETNRANWEKSNLARLPMQFKQFGRGTYALIGNNIGKVLKNQSPGERAEGLKVLAGIAATTTAFAGMMGLPTEPFRMLLLGAKAAGLTDKEWDDMELKFREITHAIAGKTGGEVLAKGLPRLLNIDLSSGLGMDNLIFFGSPRSGTDREFDNNMQAWVAQMLIGAPGTLVMQQLRGLRNLSTGQYMRAAQDLIPIKVASDTARAVRQSREGVKTPSGRVVSEPYSPTEAVSRVMGLPPGREAEENFHRRINVSHDFQERDRRGRLINEWLNASTPEAKNKAMRSAMQGGVLPRELTEAYRRRLGQERREVGATVPTRRNRDFATRSRDVLNLPSERRIRPPIPAQ